MKYLKLFEDYNKDLMHQLALQADANSTMVFQFEFRDEKQKEFTLRTF